MRHRRISLALLLALVAVPASAQDPNTAPESPQTAPAVAAPNSVEPTTTADEAPASAAGSPAAPTSAAQDPAAQDPDDPGTNGGAETTPSNEPVPPVPEASTQVSAGVGPAQTESAAGPPEGMRWDPDAGRFVPNVEPMRWRNSTIIYDHSVSWDTFFPGNRLTHNPTYTQTFSLRPRWYLSDSLSIRARQDIAVELTDTDFRTRNREPVLLDTVIDLVDINTFTFEGVGVSFGGRVMLPISLTSRAANRYGSLGAFTLVQRQFGEVLQGLNVSSLFRYVHHFADTNVPTLVDDVTVNGSSMEGIPCRISGQDAADDATLCSQASGLTSVSDDLVLSFDASLMVIENVAINTGFAFLWSRGRSLGSATIDTDTGPVAVPDQSKTHWRNLTSFYVSGDYYWAPWFISTLSYSATTPQLDPDGSRRNPFWSPDSLVSLTFTFIPDQLYAQLIAE